MTLELAVVAALKKLERPLDPRVLTLFYSSFLFFPTPVLILFVRRYT